MSEVLNEQIVAAQETISDEQLVTDTCELIRAAGENPGGTEAQTVAVLAEIAGRIGARTVAQEVFPERDNLVISLGPKTGPAFLFLGHSDVVPAGEGWTQYPFDPHVVDGAIIGRGSTDMKGGLASVLAAMAAVHDVRPDLRLDLLVTVDEEDRSQGVLVALDHMQPTPYVACVVAEPTDLDVVIGCRGAANFVIDITGASAHAGHPEDGISAIYAASRVVDVVRQKHNEFIAGEADELLGTPTFNVGTIIGGTGTSMVPRRCEITVDRRTMPEENPTYILDELLIAARKDITDSGIHGADDLVIGGRLDMTMPGFLTDRNEPLTQSAQRALADLGHRAKVTGWTAACEGGYIARHHHTPTIILGPGDINNEAHQPDERVEITHLNLAARAYVAIVLELAPGQPEVTETVTP
ncbi:MAG: M20 family metallopeptidase [Canibacter sp.]